LISGRLSTMSGGAGRVCAGAAWPWPAGAIASSETMVIHPFKALNKPHHAAHHSVWLQLFLQCSVNRPEFVKLERLIKLGSDSN